MHDSEKNSNSLPPAVAPSKRGGLLLIDDHGQRVHVPESEVEDFIADMISVRSHQLGRRIEDHLRSNHETF